MSSLVLFVANDFEDNFGEVPNASSKGANVVIIYNKALSYQLYARFQQHSLVVQSGDQISSDRREELNN